MHAEMACRSGWSSCSAAVCTVKSRAVTHAGLGRWKHRRRGAYSGLILVAALAAVATYVAEAQGTPVMLTALLLGLAVSFLRVPAGICAAGIDVAATTVLRIGVALLGLRLSLEDLFSLGVAPFVLVIAATGATLMFALLFSRVFGQTRVLALISGSAVAICGASAALAVASVLPRDRRADSELAFVVGVVTLMSTLSMLAYPPLLHWMGFEAPWIGYLLGASIHDVAQVVGAGYGISQPAGEAAVIVKMLRIGMLLPLIVVISFAFCGASGAGRIAVAKVPWFLWGFLTMAMINSLGWLPAAVTEGLVEMTTWCLVMALAAIGMRTSLQAIEGHRMRAVAFMAAQSVFLFATAVGLASALQ